MARGARPGREKASPSEEQILEEIRHRAYELYQSRAQCTEGDDMRDWLTAEAEIRQKYANND